MKHRQEGRFPEVDVACGLKSTPTWVSANRYCQYANVSNSKIPNTVFPSRFLPSHQLERADSMSITFCVRHSDLDPHLS